MRVTLLILLPLLSTGVSCEKNDQVIVHELSSVEQVTGVDGLSYAESLSKWNELKNLHGNSYIYHTSLTSFSGQGSTTELRIESGIVTSRVYQEYRIREYGRHEIIDSYSETASTLGTHQKGAPLRTINKLFETCAGEYLIVNAETNTIYFQTAEVGLMTLCGFVPNGCMDDCFTGVRITAFEWLD